MQWSKSIKLFCLWDTVCLADYIHFSPIFAFLILKETYSAFSIPSLFYSLKVLEYVKGPAG